MGNVESFNRGVGKLKVNVKLGGDPLYPQMRVNFRSDQIRPRSRHMHRCFFLLSPGLFLCIYLCLKLTLKSPGFTDYCNGSKIISHSEGPAHVEMRRKEHRESLIGRGIK
jgi:hypothetical protein